MKQLVCSQCGSETKYNFGSDYKVPVCKNCAKKEEIKLKKERDSIKNSIAKTLNFFAWAILILSILASFSYFSKMEFTIGFSLFISGVIFSLFMFGAAELIILLQMIYKKMDNN